MSNPDLPGNQTGHIETHGLDLIPNAERRGRPRELFWVWAGANVVYLHFVLGGLLTLLGLGVATAIAVIVVANLWWFAVGVIAISGPPAGSPSVVVTRIIFGTRGNRVFGAGLGAAVGLFYEVLNLALSTLAAVAVLDILGIAGPAVPLVALLVVAAGSFALSIFGHATIIALSPWITGALALCFAALACFVLPGADWSMPDAAMPATDNLAMILLGFAIIAAGPLSWGTSADFSRYLPRTTSVRKIALWTALGGAVPSILIAVLGVLAGTQIDMTDPQSSIGALVPAWFSPVFLTVVVLGTMANTVITAYSTALSFLALGIRVHRATMVVVSGALATTIAGLMLIAPSMIDALSNALELSSAILGPFIAVYLVDIVRRRNDYRAAQLTDTTAGGSCWFVNGWNLGTTAAMACGIAAAVLTANTTGYVGPVSTLLGGADVSVIVGPVVAATIAAVTWRASGETPTPQPKLELEEAHR